MKIRTKLEYVDQFRKISTLQKLPQLSADIPYLNLQKKQQNTKFIRQRQQPKLNEKKLNENVGIFLKNDIIEEYVQDQQSYVRDQFKNDQHHLQQEIKNNNEYSKNIKKRIKDNQYRYKFYYQHSSPPLIIAPESLDNNAYRIQLKDAQDFDQQIIQNKGAVPLNLTRDKYNFFIINQKRLQRDQEKNQDAVQTKIKPNQQLAKKYQRLTLKNIQEINQYTQDCSKFKYHLYNQPNLKLNQELFQKLITNSIVRQNLALNVEFLRDLGLPSRNLKEYINRNFNKLLQKKKQSSNENMFIISNIINQVKSQTQFLQLLRPTQLYISKQEINFYDIMNISTGRITQANSHLCVRSDKVTRAEYQKALKKLERYQKIEKQGGKTVVNAEVEAYESIQKQNNINKTSQLTKGSLIDEILQVKKEWKQLTKEQNDNIFLNKKLAINQIKQRITKLLSQLYNLAAQDYNIPYTLDETLRNPQYLGKIEQKKDDYQFKRIVWFIADIYHQILKEKLQAVKVTDLLKKDPIIQPIKIKYKNQKKLNLQKIQTEIVFTDKEMKKKQEKSKSPILLLNSINKTPIKNPRQDLVPTRQSPSKSSKINNTQVKLPTKTLTKSPSKVTNSKSQYLKTKKY